MKKTKFSKARIGILAAALAAVVGVGGVAAYFTDTKEATNTFQIGSIETTLTEPSWHPFDPEHPDKTKELVPDQEIPKDPTITNTGVNDAYVFMTVEVPVAYNVITAAEDGTRNPAADTQLFSYQISSDWKLVQTKSPVTVPSTIRNTTGAYAVDVDPASASSNGSITYLYAYTGNTNNMKALPNSTATTLFPAVQFVNAIEDQGLENGSFDINIKSYAIQSSFLNDGDTAIDGNNQGSAKVAPADVWEIIKTQNSVVFD